MGVLGFGFWDLGFRVLGFRAWGFRVWGSGSPVLRNSRHEVLQSQQWGLLSGSDLEEYRLEFHVCFREGLGFRVWGLGFTDLRTMEPC